MDFVYKFQSYDPVFSFSKSASFVDLKLKAFDSDDNYAQLFIMGKKAFELLEIDSSQSLYELTKDYFLHIEFLISLMPVLQAKGYLKFVNESNDTDGFDSWLSKALTPSNAYDLIELAPSLFKMGYAF